MTRDTINLSNVPVGGAYSHAVRAGGLLFLSGQTATDSATGALMSGTVSHETRQCFSNLFAVLAGAGVTSDQVVEVRVFLTDMADFQEMNAAYAEHFAVPYPARTTIGVASLPRGARVEISLVAAITVRSI